MRRPFALVMLAVLATTALRTAGGQVCLGYAPFTSGPLRAGAGYHDLPREDEFRGDLGYGINRSDFGVLGYQHTASRNSEGGNSYLSNVVDGMFGHEFALGGTSARLCPIGRLGYSSGSTEAPGFDLHLHGLVYDIGAAFGFDATDGPTRVVPSLGVKYAGNHLSGTLTRDGRTASLTTDGHVKVATLSLGISTHGITIAPYIDRQFGYPGAMAFWGVNAAINFGSIRR